MSKHDPFLTSEVPDPADAEDALIEDDLTEDDLYQTLEDESSPGEASRTIDAAEPLSEEEEEVLTDPSFRNLDRVDDPLHDDFMRRVVKRGQRGMDAVLDDAVYGDDMTKEENMERTGSDTESGWGFPGLSFIRKVATAPISLTRKVVGKIPVLSTVDRYAHKLASSPMSAAKWAHRQTVGRLIKTFVPGRDVNKAKIVKNLNRKLVVEHANFLANQDQQAGRSLQPMSYYRQLSRPWARDQISAAGLPTSFKVTGADVLGADMVGADVVGAWWNPFSWFTQTTQVVIDRTKMERSETGPDGQTTQTPSVDPSAYPPDASEPPPEGDYPAEAQGDLSLGISGDDSLGAFASEILGAAPVAANPVKIIVAKMRTGRPLSPGEVAILATSSKTDPEARRVYRLLMSRGRAVLSGDSTGAWAYKLNPLYWFKSTEEKKLVDTEKQRWIENAEARKKLEQLEKTKAASEAAALARLQAAATEAQLAAIEASMKEILTESFGDDVLGHEKPTSVSKVLAAALDKVGMKKKAAEIYAKVLRGDALSPSELDDARTIAKVVGKVKVVHGDLYQAPDPQLSALHGVFVGACLAGQIERARHRNIAVGRLATAVDKRLTAGRPLTPELEKVISGVARETVRLRGCVRSHASGRSYAGLDQAPKLRQASARAAAKAAMTDAEQKMLASIQNLAKAGNPRAVEALKKMQATGTISGGDHVDVGFSLSQAFKYVTAPVVYPLKGVGKALKWTGQKLGIVSKGSASPEQVRLNMLRAASKRRQAAAARARAAEAQTEAEMRAQNALAAAADAEADANEAEASAKEAAMMTKETEANPDVAQSYAQTDADASSGTFVGTFVGYADSADKEVLAAAAEKSPAGAQLRAGAKLYQMAAKKDPKAFAAVMAMVDRAMKGEPQAKRDLAAVKAGRKAVLAKKKAQKKMARALARKARAANVRAVQKLLEAGAADKLVRLEHKVVLRRAAVVERKATAGNKKAKKYVAAQVALAKRGDKQAARKVEMLKLARKIRVAAPNRRERRNLAAANALLVRARKGNPKAVRQIRLVQAAAKAGNPNAKRAEKRLVLAAGVLNVVAAGTPLARRPKKSPKKPVAKVEQQTALSRARAKRAAGVATREELAAGARAAQALGDKREAGELALAAASAPSAALALRNAAAVVAAKEDGHPEAVKAVEESFEAAKKGDPAAIKKMSNVMAAQTVADVNDGKPVSAAVRDAANLQARIEANDPAAIDEAKRIAEAATSSNPPAEATAAAIALGAAAATSRALAAKPKAKAEFMAKVNNVPAADLPAAEAKLDVYMKAANEGTISAADGAVAVKLAERLGKPRVAAEIAAKAPPAPEPSPLSSEPSLPLGPVHGAVEVLKASLQALTFSTPDPLANYREGVAARSRASTPPIVSGEAADSLGWSPFDFFKKLGQGVARNLPVLLPGVSAAASTAAAVLAMQQKKSGGSKPAPAPAPAAKAPETQAPTTEAAPTADEPAKVSSSGVDVDALQKYIFPTAETKQITKADMVKYLNTVPIKDRAMAAHNLVLGFKARGVKIIEGDEVSSSGSEDKKTFADLVKAALRSKKMSRADFNKAVDAHVDPKEPKVKKVAAAEQTLKWLAKKGVKVET